MKFSSYTLFTTMNASQLQLLQNFKTERVDTVNAGERNENIYVLLLNRYFIILCYGIRQIMLTYYIKEYFDSLLVYGTLLFQDKGTHNFTLF